MIRYLAFALLLGCASDLDAAASYAFSSRDGVSLRLVGDWSGEDAAAVARACDRWNVVLASDRRCRVDPSGSVEVLRADLGGKAVGEPEGKRQLLIGLTVTTPREMERAAMNAISRAIDADVYELGCSVTSDEPPDEACWERLTPLDVSRCRNGGFC